MQPRCGDDIRGRVRRLFAFFVTEISRLRTLGNASAARDYRHQEIVQQLLRHVLREGDLGPENHHRSADASCISKLDRRSRPRGGGAGKVDDLQRRANRGGMSTSRGQRNDLIPGRRSSI